MAGRRVTLLSAEGQRFEVDEAVAKMSVTIANFMDDQGGITSVDAPGGDIPLHNVRAPELARVLEFCAARASCADTAEFDASFAATISRDDMPEMLLAANYLDIAPLLDALCQAVADEMKGKTTEELREMLGIENDLTPGEEEQIRRENAWSFD